MDEQILIARLKEGDETAFTVLYKKYWQKVYNFSHMYLSSSDEVEEVVQNVFVNLWESRSFIKEKERLEGFLFVITRNLVFNQFRKSFNEEAYRATMLSVDSLQTTYSVEDELCASDLKEYIDYLMKELSPRQQEVFRLSRVEHLSYREIAIRLSISEKTVERHINDALRFFRQNLRLLSLFLMA